MTYTIRRKKKINKSIQIHCIVEDWIYRRIQAVVENDDCSLSISDFVRQAIKFKLEKKYGIEIIDLIPFEQRMSLTQTDVVLAMISNSQDVFNVSELRKVLIKPSGETRKIQRKHNESIRKMLGRMIDKKIVVKQGIIKIPQIGSNKVGEFSIKTSYVLYSLSPDFLGGTTKFRNLTRIILKTLNENPKQLHSKGNFLFKVERKGEFYNRNEWKNVLNSLHDLKLLKQINVSSNTYFASLRYAEPENRKDSMMVSIRISTRLSTLLNDLGILSTIQNKKLFLLKSIKLFLQEFPNDFFQNLRPNVLQIKEQKN